MFQIKKSLFYLVIYRMGRKTDTLGWDKLCFMPSDYYSNRAQYVQGRFK